MRKIEKNFKNTLKAGIIQVIIKKKQKSMKKQINEKKSIFMKI